MHNEGQFPGAEVAQAFDRFQSYASMSSRAARQTQQPQTCISIPTIVLSKPTSRTPIKNAETVPQRNPRGAGGADLSEGLAGAVARQLF